MGADPGHEPPDMGESQPHELGRRSLNQLDDAARTCIRYSGYYMLGRTRLFVIGPARLERSQGSLPSIGKATRPKIEGRQAPRARRVACLQYPYAVGSHTGSLVQGARANGGILHFGIFQNSEV